MIEISSVLLGGEFIYVRLAGLVRRRRDADRTVHLIRQYQSMPMDGRILRQLVFYVDPHKVALPDMYARAWDLIVIGVGIDGYARQNGPSDNRRAKLEYLDAVVHAKRKLLGSPAFQSERCRNETRMRRRHVSHRVCRRIAVHAHPRRHDGAANITH